MDQLPCLLQCIKDVASINLGEQRAVIRVGDKIFFLDPVQHTHKDILQGLLNPYLIKVFPWYPLVDEIAPL